MAGSTTSSSSASGSHTPMPNSVIAILSAAGMPYYDGRTETTASSLVTPTTFSTLPSSSIPSPTHATSTGAGSFSTHTPQPGSHTGRRGLDTAAAAGIGVGATLGVVVLGILAALWWRRRRRSWSAGASKLDDSLSSDSSEVEVQTVSAKTAGDQHWRSEADDTSPGGRVVEAGDTSPGGKLLEAGDTSPGGELCEAGSTEKAELAAQVSVAELDGGYSPAELDSPMSMQMPEKQDMGNTKS